MTSKDQNITGTVRSQDLSVSWLSEKGINKEDTDSVCILMMANGQVRLTMRSATLNLKGMRLTKGHACVFALFEAAGPESVQAADRASEVFMNNMMKNDITKKPASKIIKKCISAADKAVAKEFSGQGYKASAAAFASKYLTVCSVSGGTLRVIGKEGAVTKLSSDGTEISVIGDDWQGVLMTSAGYPVRDDDIEEEMNMPIDSITEKKELRPLLTASSMIRVHRLE